MKFIDEAKIEVHAGNGGAGCTHFRREKYVPRGGPDGGNGGSGGSVILTADLSKHTLLDFRFKPLWKADNGKPGEKQLKDGRSGKDLIIPVPIGTEVLDPDSNDLLADLTEDGQRFIIAKGGRGGKGNTFFKSATNQTPRHSQPGEEGKSGSFLLSLKLIADVGLVGFPNAGKSTLISCISSAKPKIADYPFTTLTPNLGVVKFQSERPFVVADVPGLVPGAHQGKGLGHTFLKHLERTSLLLHLIDPFQLDEEGEAVAPEEAYDTINRELTSFSEAFGKKEQIVIITKIDAIGDADQLMEIEELFRNRGVECLSISSISKKGLDKLLAVVTRRLEARRRPEEDCDE